MVYQDDNNKIENLNEVLERPTTSVPCLFDLFSSCTAYATFLFLTSNIPSSFLC